MRGARSLAARPVTTGGAEAQPAPLGTSSTCGHPSSDGVLERHNVIRTRLAQLHRRAAQWALRMFREDLGLRPGERIPDGEKWPAIYNCGKPLGPSDVLVNARSDIGRATIANVQTCGCIWTCPECMWRYRTRIAAEVHQAVEAHAGAGGGFYLVTLTIPHKRDDGLEEMLDLISEGWRTIASHRRWKDLRKALEYLGYVKALEITHGVVNGWHPHSHMLLFCGGGATAEMAEEVRRTILELWSSFLARKGWPLPDSTHGVDVKPVGKDWQTDAAAYVAKITGGLDGLAEEVSRLDSKDGRRGSVTPLQLLEDERGYRLWAEYARATKGRRAVWFSRGLRERLGMGPQAPDAEVVEAEAAAGEPIAEVDGAAYAEALKDGYVPRFLALMERGDYASAARVIGCEVVGWSLVGGSFIDQSEGLAEPRTKRRGGRFLPVTFAARVVPRIAPPTGGRGGGRGTIGPVR